MRSRKSKGGRSVYQASDFFAFCKARLLLSTGRKVQNMSGVRRPRLR
jgi:hypothetical protein